MEDRRRSGDGGLLSQLLQQNQQQHSENRETLRQINAAVQLLALKDENHSGRIGVLETWRTKEADPLLEVVRDGRAELRGAGKAAVLVREGVKIAGAGGIAAGIIKGLALIIGSHG